MQFSSRHQYAVVLAVISILILVIGILLKPVPPSTSKRDDLTVTRAELENLERVVRRNNLRNLSNTFSSIGEEASSHLTAVSPTGVNGVRLPELEMVVAKRLDALPRELTTLGGSHQRMEPALWVPGLPFFTGHLLGGGLTPADVTNSTPRQGDWVIVVADGVFGQVMISPGIYNGVVQADCGPFIQYRLLTTVPLNQSHAGGGLFDLAGNLQGVVLPCDDALAAIPVSEVKKAAFAASTAPNISLARYGVRFSDFAPAGSTQSRVLVQEVWDQWPADRAGLHPGDEVLAVDNHAVSLVQDVAAAMQASANPTLTLRIRRGSQNLQAQLSPISEAAADEVRPSLLVEDSSGVDVTRVMMGSSAERSGIRARDRILTISGKPATVAACAKLFGAFRIQESAAITVGRPGRRILLQVQP